MRQIWLSGVYDRTKPFIMRPSHLLSPLLAVVRALAAVLVAVETVSKAMYLRKAD